MTLPAPDRDLLPAATEIARALHAPGGPGGDFAYPGPMPTRLAEVLVFIRNVGVLLGRDAQAERLVQNLEARLQRVRGRTLRLVPRPVAFAGLHAGWLAEVVAIAGGELVDVAQADLVLTGPAALTRPTQCLVEAIEQLACTLHPATFPDLAARWRGSS